MSDQEIEEILWEKYKIINRILESLLKNQDDLVRNQGHLLKDVENLKTKITDFNLDNIRYSIRY